jgi:hypothetical protein
MSSRELAISEIKNGFNVDFNTIFAVIFRTTIAKYTTLLLLSKMKCCEIDLRIIRVYYAT